MNLNFFFHAVLHFENNSQCIWRLFECFSQLSKEKHNFQPYKCNEIQCIRKENQYHATRTECVYFACFPIESSTVVVCVEVDETSKTEKKMTTNFPI